MLSSANCLTLSLRKSVILPSVILKSHKNRWGCQHEKTARQAYAAWASQQHQGLIVNDAGFHIHPCYPCIGASPDSLVSCTCCGSGVLEIKCPHCAKDTGVLSATANKHFCLVNTESGFGLDKEHQYYYQVQAQ
ncbi:hypothetical protein GJAV_G00078890 [Gymnothorax javanicus]|nr:hypothetical protein GJAV_G00078890 [Gymnothorax javanicus]